MSTAPDSPKTIAQFLIDLVDRAAEWAGASAEGRREIMDKYGLTREQQAVIELGDLKILQSYLDYEYARGLLPDEAGAGAAMVITYRPPPAPPPTYAPTRARRIPTY